MLTNRRFAQLASYMAREIMAWVGDSLDDYTDDDGKRRIDKPMSDEALHRFCDGIRARLDRLENADASLV